MANTLSFDVVAHDKASRVFDGVGKKSGLLGKSLGAIGAAAKVGLAGATVAAAGLGAVLTKGFTRLANIEDANAKLRGLGHTAQEVQTIMTGALAAVKGTAFGLDEAASVAASAVAAGIKPGKDLNRVLGTIADTATIAGSSFSEAGAIIDKVAASNRLSLEEVNQLSDRGVPILQFLAKQYGKNQAAVRKMVTEGKVDFADFAKALDTNLGGAAKKSGDTTRGAFANLNAAISRLGAGLLSGLFPTVKLVFGGLTKEIDKATAAAAPFGEAISKKLAAGLQKLVPAAKEAFAGLQSVIQQFVSGFSGALSGQNGPLSGAAALGQQVRDIFDEIEPVLKRFGTTQLAIGKAVLSGLKPAFEAIVPLIATLAPLFRAASDAVQKIIPAFAAIAKAIGTFIAAIIPTIQPFIDQIVKILGPAFNDIANIIVSQVVPAFSAFLTAITPVVQFILKYIVGPAIIGALKGLVQGVKGALQLIAGVFQLFADLLTGNWSKLWADLGKIVSAAWQVIVGIVKIALNVGVGKAFSLGFKLIAKLGGAGFNALRTLFDKAMVNLAFLVGKGVGKIVTWFKGLPGKAINALAGLGKKLSDFFSKAFASGNKAVTTKVTSLIKYVKGIPAKIKSGLGNLGNLLYNAGKTVVQGLINGIANKISALRRKVGSLASIVKNALPNSPAAKEGPLKGVHFEDIGAAIVNDLRRGLESGHLGPGIGSVASRIAGASRIPIAPIGAAPAGHMSPGAVYITLHFSGPVGSQQQLHNWLSTSLDSLHREGRLRFATR